MTKELMCATFEVNFTVVRSDLNPWVLKVRARNVDMTKSLA